MTDQRRAAPGRAQLVEAALHLIGERGIKAATVRAVADEAGVTPGLVVHHFGTKDKLGAAVEDLVIERFSAAMAVDSADSDHATDAIAARLSATIGADPALRAYVRRAILEGTTAGAAILDRLVGLTIANLRRYADPEKLPAGNELSWLATQIVTINLAGTLLEPLLPGQPFSPVEVRRRTAANRELTGAVLARYAKT